jgi:hypothetical protein
MKRFFVLLFPLVSVIAQPTFDEPARRGYESITANDLSSHLHFLASPELEGRETTFRGQKVAARYIASMFQKSGLKPIGDNGTYFQKFDLEVTRISEQTQIVLRSAKGQKKFSVRKDFLTNSIRDTSISTRVVFVGSTDGQIDKKAEEMIRGSIVITLPGSRQETGEGTPTQLRRLLPSRAFEGSVATFVVLEESGPLSLASLEHSFSSALDKGMMRLPGTEDRRGSRTNHTYYVSPELAVEAFAAAGKNFDFERQRAKEETSFSPLVLDGLTVQLDAKVIREMKPTENVVGMIEGDDPILKNEVVVFTAHYDHIGIGSDGAIYYGADDDGSGTSAVLELAEAFATNPVKPKRSLIFLAVTGEEKGLLGSAYYTQNPIVPLEKTVANLNTDMIGRVDRKYQTLNNPNYVYVIGSDKISTELDSLLRVANSASENLLLDYTYNDENDPNQFYRRSDHYNFARNGIPVIFFFTGLHEDYHRPTDTVDKILFDRTAKITRLMYLTGWKVANFSRSLRKNAGAAASQ